MTDHAQNMIDYICQKVIREKDVHIDANTPLVSSGLIDSFSLVEILLQLEDVTSLRIPAGKVQPKDMDTVTLMLETASRVGRPRK
jgi:acyl carrier protein